MKFILFAFGMFVFGALQLFAQEFDYGTLKGDFQSDFQIYKQDSSIGAPDVPEKLLFNGYLNIFYNRNNFTAGVRFESYQNALLGIDPRYKGNGIASRWINYKHKDFEITAGNFYEQFGSGIILRSYEDRSLGLDNSIDGMRLIYTPIQGITFKGLIGQHRYFFDKGTGIVRGADAEVYMNDLCEKWKDKNLKITFGSSVVSKYQQDKDPLYVLPENVAAFSSRLNIMHRKKMLFAEYAYKINDPSAVNKLIYKDGQALYVTGSYSTKGFSTSLGVKRIDNMNFRSDRAATGNVLQINYLPALSTPHSYTLSGFYPYATQPNGEMGLQGRIAYKIPKTKKLGGPYGTDVTLNFSRIHDIEKNPINDTTSIGKSGTIGYNSPFFGIGEDLFYQDVNLSIGTRLNKNLRISFDNVYFIYNVDVIEGHDGGMIYAHIGIIDMSYRLQNSRTIRWELQHLTTEQDDGNWAMGLFELTLAPKWSFGISSLYNYGNDDKELQHNFLLASVSYTNNSSRIAISMGKQREGIVCVGGVCRYVPASNGVAFSVTTNF